MPGFYIAKRGQPPGRAGLQLPFTPTQGPILLGADTANFLDVPMGPPWSGNFAALEGIRTSAMTNCMVVCVVQAVGNGWGLGYFNHIPGGYWRRDQDWTWMGFRNAVAAQDCYGVVFSGFQSGIGGLVDAVATFVPLANMSVYVTSIHETDLAVARAGGYFGETRSTGDVSDRSYYGFGRCGPVRRNL
ncbi:hypothetical protein [Falsiroseomonas oryzae]|uniref:hypothetical protein n=1 Tax=Falsiroseomonas oryzae TaxID=2766473 RepID=UPI0022EB437C|nr:hypothetical protein [Roseomonas sp. MO-31]